MSHTASSGRAGDFASSSRPRAAEHADFIWARHAAGVPTSAIANMIGCNVVEVKAFIDLCAKSAERSQGPAKPYISRATRTRAIKRLAAKAKPCLDVKIPTEAADIIQAHADSAGVSFDTFLSRCYPIILRDARHACWAELYATRRYIYAEIGYWFGRSASPIHNGVTRGASGKPDQRAWRSLSEREAA